MVVPPPSTIWWHEHIPKQITILPEPYAAANIVKLEKLGEGTFSNDYKVHNKATGAIWWMKRLVVRRRYKEEVLEFVEWMAALHRLLNLGGVPSVDDGRPANNFRCSRRKKDGTVTDEDLLLDPSILEESIEWSRCDVDCANKAFLESVLRGLPPEVILQLGVGGQVALPFAVTSITRSAAGEVSLQFFFNFPSLMGVSSRAGCHYPSVVNFGTIVRDAQYQQAVSPSSSPSTSPGSSTMEPPWKPIPHRYNRPFVLSLFLMLRTLHEMGISGVLGTGGDEELLLTTVQQGIHHTLSSPHGKKASNLDTLECLTPLDAETPLLPLLVHLRVPWSSHALTSTTASTSTKQVVLKELEQRALNDVVSVAVCLRGLSQWPVARVFSSWQVALRNADETLDAKRTEIQRLLSRQQPLAKGPSFLQEEDDAQRLGHFHSMQVVHDVILQCKDPEAVKDWDELEREERMITSLIPGPDELLADSGSSRGDPPSVNPSLVTIPVIRRAIRSSYFGLRSAQVLLEHRLHCIEVRKDRMTTMFVTRDDVLKLPTMYKPKLCSRWTPATRGASLNPKTTVTRCTDDDETRLCLPWEICCLIGFFAMGIVEPQEERWYLW